MRQALGVGQQPLVLTVGRLAPQKDYPTLLSVAARVHESTPDAVFVVVGDGPLREPCRPGSTPSTCRCGCSDIGPMSPTFSAAADVFLLTSHWEARALVIQEAMQVGVPVVATAVGGIPELVEGSAVLAFPGDADGLADGVRAVLTEPRPRTVCGREGRELAAGWPDEDAVAKNLLDIYAGLVATRG